MRLNIKEIPNILTISRIAIIPIFFISFYLDSSIAEIFTAILFLFASLTDFFDGYLARTLKAQSCFGKLFDPIADKMIVATAIIMLVHTKKIGYLGLIPSTIIICREFFISGFREYVANKNISIPVSRMGKIKTILQMIAILLLLLNPSYYPIMVIANVALWSAAILSVVSGFKYIKQCDFFKIQLGKICD